MSIEAAKAGQMLESTADGLIEILSVESVRIVEDTVDASRYTIRKQNGEVIGNYPGYLIRHEQA